MHNFITWYDILIVFIWTISIYTAIAVILLTITHFTEKLRNKKSELPQEKPQPKDRFKIVECSNKDKYKFQASRPELPPPPIKTNEQQIDINCEKLSIITEKGLFTVTFPYILKHCPLVELSDKPDCQNLTHNGKCTSFVCTKIVRFK